MIKGKPLPLVEEIAPPSAQELDELTARWNANVDQYYVGLLEAQPLGTPNATSRFLWDRSRLEYIHRTSGRRITRKEYTAVYMRFVETMSRKK